MSSPVYWSNPNQQVVREDQSGPGYPDDPGHSGEAGPGGLDELDELTKAELLERAQSMGISPANNDMTKDELKAGIRAAGG
jgi:hypothetical protein